MSENKTRPLRDEFGYLCPVDSRWADNDVYGHINNVVYYSYFDSTINRYLIEQGGLDIHDGDVIAYVVSSGCDYFEAAAYPDALAVGMRVDKLGNSSVRYGLALFGAEGAAKALGFVVHVFVDRASGRPVPIPERLREALAALGRESSD
ncbi:acyl-CoA thioesterase [Alloalcanivorax gelatiniphagus]|uniref:Acyl-CoA thioesterase n=1 Tax=Alloalcanivorax gelatiniphagus TaxID=1194167 RepID=A0ABY2XN86_9GAMM|nr:thioesterase family protein [Alloalcanivorax gelatiniphagus]TMW13892.1 acyl-CoA thioesterase [Alloalcanivorax gelatiniphagus]|tara:strand:- start:1864 stop:2310 length:447 start_codon:yes stop_codon:yes gene_type:complete